MSWSLSDSATTLLGVVFTALVGLVGAVWAARITAKGQPEKPDFPPAPPVVPAKVAKAVSPISPVVRREVTANLSMIDIVSAVQAAKPYHRDAVHANYVGLRVRWYGRFESISRGEGENAYVTVRFQEGKTLGFCTASMDEVTALIDADEGTAVEVTGTINEAMMIHEVMSDDCQFELILVEASSIDPRRN